MSGIDEQLVGFTLNLPLTMDNPVWQAMQIDTLRIVKLQDSPLVASDFSDISVYLQEARDVLKRIQGLHLVVDSGWNDPLVEVEPLPFDPSSDEFGDEDGDEDEDDEDEDEDDEEQWLPQFSVGEEESEESEEGDEEDSELAPVLSSPRAIAQVMNKATLDQFVGEILHRICRSPDGAQQEFERYLSELLDIVGAGADFYLGAESVEIPVEPAAVQQLNADVAIEVFLLVVQELIVDFPESYGDRCSELSLISTVLNTELSELLQRHSEAV